MPKAERENGNVAPPIDIPCVIKSVLRKDENATKQLDEALRQRLMPFFIRRGSNQAEDLTQDTVIKVSTALPTFDPNWGKGNCEQNFWGWVFMIGRNTMIDNHRREVRQGGIGTVPISENAQYPDAKEDGQAGKECFYQIDDQAILNLIKSRFPRLLTESEQETVELRVAGKKNKEIAKLRSSTEGSVKVRMTRARAKIEREILEKIGLKPTDAFEKRFQQAVVCGRVRSIKILGRYYVREEDARNYKGQEIDQKPPRQGYVLLSQAVTLSEYLHFAHGDAPLRHAGRLYIKTDDLEEFRKIHKKRRKERIFPPSPNHKRLVNLCQTVAQYRRAGDAIRTGRLPAIKGRHALFVKEEDFSTWAETLGK